MSTGKPIRPLLTEYTGIIPQQLRAAELMRKWAEELRRVAKECNVKISLPVHDREVLCEGTLEQLDRMSHMILSFEEEKRRYEDRVFKETRVNSFEVPS